MESTDEPVELVERVAALDLGKAALMACVRVPHEDRPVLQQHIELILPVGLVDQVVAGVVE